MKVWVLILIAVFAASVTAKSLYNHQKSYVTPLTSLNFEPQIPKIRQTTKFVSIVHYYKYSDGASKDFAKAFDEFTNEFRGVFKILACDCDENPQVCEKEKISKFPTIRVYPPNPVPPSDYEGELDPKKVMNVASRYLESNVVSITKANIDTFINENPSVPKVFLFTDKKGIPTIYKSLSISFDKKLLFGIIRSDDQDLVDRYNVNKFPKIIVVKASEKKPKVYNGEIKFQSIFDFLNIYSETFVPGGGSSQDSAATKAWLTELVPEMNYKSANDICIKVEAALCVVLLDKARPEKSHIDLMKELFKVYEKKISRGSTFKFMWLNTEREKAWAELFSAPKVPAVAILNPGKRKRFVLHEGELNLNSLKSTLDKINGGDAKFNQIKTPDLPSFEIFTEPK